MSMYNSTPDVWFAPEGADPDEAQWTVTETEAINAQVNLKTKTAEIPRARTRASEEIRLHEMAHVAHTDLHTHDFQIQHELCKMLEEIRVDAIMFKKGIDLRHRHDDFDWSQNPGGTAIWERVAWDLQTYFQVSDPTVDPVLIKFWQQQHGSLPAVLQRMVVDAATELINNPTLEVREKWADTFGKYFQPPISQKPDASSLPKKAVVVEEIARQVQAEYEQQVAQEQAEQEKLNKKRSGNTKNQTQVTKLTTQELAELEKTLGDEGDIQPGGGIGGFSVVDGAVEIHDHIARLQKVVQVKAPFTRTGKGLTPEFMENFCIDRRIYRTEHRGGVVVIDTSGSMRPNWDIIERQMLDFPNLVVISYGGVTRDRQSNSRGKPGIAQSGIVGRICVHSRNGKIDPHFIREPGRDYGNNCDIEALEHGAKFKGPRVWVSDGHACGGTFNKRGGYDTISRLIQQHHYVRVLTLEDALAWVSRSRPVIHYRHYPNTAERDGGHIDHNDPKYQIKSRRG